MMVGCVPMIRASAFVAAFVLAASIAAAQAPVPPPASVATPPASLPAPSDAAKSVLGTWEISNSDRDRTCIVTFKSDTVPSGFKLEFDRGCATGMPFTKDAVAWVVGSNDSIRMIDAKGTILLELTEVEAGMYEAERRGEGILFMQAAAAVPVQRTVEQLVGEWAVTRGGTRTICMVTLSNTAAGEDALALTVKPGCDALITRFNPTSWRIDQNELVLVGAKGDTWRFEEREQSTWHRVPQRTQLITLVRK
jgi:hypothetical protein